MKPVAAICIFLLYLCGAYGQDATRPAYLDPSKPIDQRVADLIGRMTFEERHSS